MASTFNFDSIIPATPVLPVNGYIILPAFSYEDIGWKGASEVVTQFNYTASKNFVLRRLPTKPTAPNFVPVISYRIGMQTFRYKLWENVGEKLAEILYNGQVIKKNFKIEIWNVETSEEVSLEEAIQITLSIKQILTNFSSVEDFEDNVGIEVPEQSQQSVAPSPVSNGLLAWYATGSGYEDTVIQSGGLISQWQDSSGNGHHLNQGVNLDKPQAVIANGFTRLSFDTGRWIGKTGGGFDAGTKIFGFYLVAAYQFNPPNGVVLDFGSMFGRVKNNGASTRIDVRGTGGVYVAFPVFSDTIKSQAYVRYNSTFEDYRCGADTNFLAPLDIGTLMSSLDPDDMSQITIGDFTSFSSANMVVYELLVYNTQLTDAEHIQILQYLANKYNDAGGFVLPLEWNTNLPQTTN